MSRNVSRNTRRSGPPIVVPDLQNGCESTACYVAQTFYNCCRDHITNINKRNDFREFFITSQRYWFPPELTERNEFRHFDQVLYALVNDGQVCRVVRNDDGSHGLRWGINNFQKPRSHLRNHPKKRINWPVHPINDDGEIISNTQQTTTLYEPQTPPYSPLSDDE